MSGTRAYVAYFGSLTLQVFDVPNPPQAVAVNADGTLGSVALLSRADFVQNQAAVPQDASFHLGGTATVGGTVTVDAAGANMGTVGGAGPSSNILRFGSTISGEGIASKRNGGGNVFGLDFYTDKTNRPAITVDGKVGVGTSSPATRLDVNGNLGLAVGTCPANTSASYTLTAADLATSIFKLQDWAHVNPVVLPPAGAGQLEGQALTIVNVAAAASSVSGANTDNGAAVALAGLGTAGVHALQYVWVLNSAGSGY